MDKNKIFFFAKSIIFIAIFIVWLAGLKWIHGQPVYRDSYNISDSSEYICTVNNMGQKIEQQFQAPCDGIVESLALQIGNYAGNSRSDWKAELFESGTGNRIYDGTFEADRLKDNLYNNILDDPVEVQKGRSYRLAISPISFQNDSGLAFYADDTGKQGRLIDGAKETSFNLSMKIVYASEQSGFLTGMYIAVSLFALMIFFRILWLRRKNLPWYCDRIVQTMIIMLVYYFLQQGVLNIYPFIDENDNIRGGMVIAEGNIIYRDYITQHMPLMYYLCGLFALLGAGSIPQFRLLYYMLCSLIAGFIYMRNAEKFGKYRIGLFLLLQPFVLYTIHGSYIFFILSDNIQALAMVVLLLEYLDYRQTYEIDLKRSIIVASSIYAGFGCAFLSAYSIAVIVAGVIISEVVHFRKSGQPVSFYIKRYQALFLSCLIPLILFLAYFFINGTFGQAFEMAYSFNTEIYPEYIGTCRTKLEPVTMGFYNFFSTIFQTIRLLPVQPSRTCVVQLLLLLMSAFYIGKEIWKKNYFTAVTVFMFLCMCFTRGQDMTNFHAAPLWNVALLIVFLDTGIAQNPKTAQKQSLAVAAVLGLVTFLPYAQELKSSIFSEHAVEINEWERFVVANTEEKDTIFIDSTSFESIYLQYKDRYAANRLPYFLPWYMDWYQDDTIQDLKEKQPELLLYNPDLEVWDIKGFMEPLRRQIDKDYVLDEESGVYIRK